MPLPDVVNLVCNLSLYDANINTWKNGVERALKKFIPDGTKPADHNVRPVMIRMDLYMKKVV